MQIEAHCLLPIVGWRAMRHMSLELYVKAVQSVTLQISLSATR